MLHTRRQKRIWVAMVICVTAGFLSSCASSQNKREEADLHLRIGTAMWQQGNYPGALRELLTAERLNPQNEVIQNNLGLAYFARERFDLAAEHIRKAVELKPEYTEARNNYGRTLIELGRYDEAITELNAVMKDLTYEAPAKGLINLGLAYFKKGEFRTAKAKLAEALKIDRENCLGQTLYGRSFLELAEFETAAKVLDNAVVICRAVKYEEPNYYSGLSYYKLGRTSSAIARMEEIIKLYPQSRYAKKAQSLLKLMR